MSQSVLTILGLVGGILAGVLVKAAGGAPLQGAAAAIRPIGDLWLSLLQMTVLPLVISLLITGIASARDAASNGRTAAGALVVFLLVLTGAAVTSALVTPMLIAVWGVDADAAAALRASLSPGVAVPAAPSLSDWYRNIVPTNPFKAAADGAILPLVVFALLFGLAASHLATERRAVLVGFFEAVVDTMLTIVGWVLRAAPAGVFALAINVGLLGGIAAATAITRYLFVVCTLALLLTLAMYLVVALWSDVPVPRFARAAVPAQVVAVSTQSSLASLPAMLTAAQGPLALPVTVTGIVLPLAVSLFRMTSPPLNLAIVLFVAHVHGIALGPWQIAVGTLVAIVTSLSVVSLPSAITFFTTTVPISLAMGVPVELLSLLIAVEVFPDLFRTVGNVTADLTVTAVIARTERRATASAIRASGASSEPAQPRH